MPTAFWPLAAPPPPPSAAQALVELGYENVRARASSESLTVWYENRRRPTQLEALADVLTAVAMTATGDPEVRVIPLREDQPLLLLTTRPGAIARARVAGGWLEASVRREAPDPPPDPLAPTFNHSDVALQPAIRFDQSSYALLARADACTPLGPGVSLLGRLQGAVYPQPGLDPPRAAFRSSGWMAPDVPAVFQIAFDGPQPQLQGEVAWELFRGLGFLKLRGGMAQDRFPELVARAEAHLPWWDLALSGGWGTYPAGDSGPFAVLTRTYSRTRLDFGAFGSEYGTKFQATIQIDLGPNPRPAPSALRLIPVGPWKFTYRATAYAGSETLQPAPDVDEFLDRLTPAYVEAHLDRLPWPEALR